MRQPAPSNFESVRRLEHAENVACIAAALRDMEAGDKGRPAGEVIQEMRTALQMTQGPAAPWTEES